jgi:glycosyltransferase involved in cell wall biosynthesis
MITKAQNNSKSYEYQVSAIVPCYNVLAYIDKCLETLVQQTLTAIEIITINDASTDGTGARLNEWQSQYPKTIKVIHHQTNLGLPAARNSGLAVAKGECIGFVDSDDYVDTTMFAKLYQALINNNADIAECDYTQVHVITGRIINKRSKFNTIKSEKNNIIDLLTKGCFSCKCLYTSNFLITNNIKFNENIQFYEDILFSYDAIIKSTSLVCIPDKLYYYQLGRQGQITSFNDKELYSLFKIFDYIDKKLIHTCKNYKLINSFFIYTQITHFFYFRKKINKQYRFDFFTKAVDYLFTNTQATTIYKILLISRYRKPIDYLRVPIFVVIAHIYYLVNKFIIANIKKRLN